MKDLRLLQIVPNLESGGAEQGAIEVANYVGIKGFKSFIASNGGRMLTQISRNHVQHIKLSAHSKNPLVIFKNIKKIKNIILNNNINLVHIRSRAPAWSVYYASKDLCKTSSTFHNVYNHQNLIKRYYNKRLSKVNNIVAISEYVKKSITNIYKIDVNKITVIHRGIDINFFNPEIKNDELAYLKFIKQYHVPNDKQIILYPGRLTQWKGQIEFLKILELLESKDFICYFVGDDKNKSYRVKLEKEINIKNLSSNCKVIGHIDMKNLYFMYKSADIVVSAPLQPEGFCRVISEGLAMEKIVLCYNFGGAKEQILGLDNFYAVEPFNKNQMINKIKKALNLSMNQKKQMGEMARMHILKNFTKQIMLEKYLNFYHKIIL